MLAASPLILPPMVHGSIIDWPSEGNSYVLSVDTELICTHFPKTILDTIPCMVEYIWNNVISWKLSLGSVLLILVEYHIYPNYKLLK